MSDQHCYSKMRILGYETPSNPGYMVFQAEVCILVEHVVDAVLLKVSSLDSRIVYDPTHIVPWVLENRGKYKNRSMLRKKVEKECLGAWA